MNRGGRARGLGCGTGTQRELHTAMPHRHPLPSSLRHSPSGHGFPTKMLKSRRRVWGLLCTRHSESVPIDGGGEPDRKAARGRRCWGTHSALCTRAQLQQHNKPETRGHKRVPRRTSQLLLCPRSRSGRWTSPVPMSCRCSRLV